MKKIFSVLALALTMFSATSFAQSNLTMTMKEKADDAYFKRKEFTFYVSGINNPKEAALFLSKMKENTDVSSAVESGKDKSGNFMFAFTMKNVFDKSYYLNWVIKLDVSHVITFKGENKTPQEMLAAKETK